MIRQEDFDKAVAEVWRILLDKGWVPSKANLRIPYITSPNGRFRLWVKGQAIRYSCGTGVANFDNAHTTWAVRQRGRWEVRKVLDPQQFVYQIESEFSRYLTTPQ